MLYKKPREKESSIDSLIRQMKFLCNLLSFPLTIGYLSTILKAVFKKRMEVYTRMKFHDQSCSYYSPKLVFIALFMTIVLLTGCSQTTNVPETGQMTSLTGTIVEIDDHGNAVTDLYIAPFTERGWELGDMLEATFATGQKIQIKFVENYGDVPEGEYLGRFSTSTQQFKIAINMGNIAESLKLKSESKVVLQKVAAPSTN